MKFKIKFENYEGTKYYFYGPFEFFVNRNENKYTLTIDRMIHVPDAYQINKTCSKRVEYPKHEPIDLDTIRTMITNFINNYNETPC